MANITAAETSDSIHEEYTRLERDLYARIWRRLEPLSVNRLCLSYLLYIAAHPACKVSEVADAMHMDKASVTRALASLGKLGYVDRRVGKLDTRAFDLYLTPAGRAIIRDVEDITRDWERDLRDAMGEDEFHAAAGALRHARERFVRLRAQDAAELSLREPGTAFFY